MIPPKQDSSSQYCPSLIMGKLHFDTFHSAAYLFISQQDDQVGSDLDCTSSNPYKMSLEEYFNPNPESNTRGKTLNNFKTCVLISVCEQINHHDPRSEYDDIALVQADFLRTSKELFFLPH